MSTYTIPQPTSGDITDLIADDHRLFAEALESGKDFGRYLDVDADGIAYRTYPGTHPRRPVGRQGRRPVF